MTSSELAYCAQCVGALATIFGGAFVALVVLPLL